MAVLRGFWAGLVTLELPAAMIDVAAYRPLALALARQFFIPGADRDDVEQEAMVGLMNAVRDYRPDRGASFRSFAELCIRRQLITAIKTANRFKHRPLNEAIVVHTTEDGDLSLIDVLPAPGTDPVDIVLAREEAFEILRVVGEELSPLEQRVLIAFANGMSLMQIGKLVGGPTSYQSNGQPRNKRVENALERARRKLADPPTWRQLAEAA